MALTFALCACLATSPVNFTSAPPAHQDNSGFANVSRMQMMRIQESLQWLGYYHGRVDGRFTQPVWLAVESFQVDHGMIPDGFPGIETRLTLRLAVSQSC